MLYYQSFDVGSLAKQNKKIDKIKTFLKQVLKKKRKKKIPKQSHRINTIYTKEVVVSGKEGNHCRHLPLFGVTINLVCFYYDFQKGQNRVPLNIILPLKPKFTKKKKNQC